MEAKPQEAEVVGDSAEVTQLKSLIRSVPDFPSPGILFRDITPLLGDAAGLRATFKLMADQLRSAGLADKIDLIAGMEARGFLVGVGLALELNVGFVMLRKPNKLPGDRHTVSYGKEYGKDVLEIPVSAVKAGQRVVVTDDLIATGGTALAACQLVEKAGGVVAATSFVISLDDLPGKAKLAAAGYPVVSLLNYA